MSARAYVTALMLKHGWQDALQMASTALAELSQQFPLPTGVPLLEAWFEVCRAVTHHMSQGGAQNFLGTFIQDYVSPRSSS